MHFKEKRIVVCCSGRGSNLAAIIEAIRLERLHCKIVAVIADQEGISALEIARAAKLPAYVFATRDYASKLARDQAMVAQLEQLEPIDLIVFAGWLQIAPQFMVERFHGRIINLHPSLLPKYGGAGYYGERVFQTVLDSREPVTGITFHYVDTGIDTGEIIMQVFFSVRDGETLETLAAYTHIQEHRWFPVVIEQLLHGY